MIGPEFPAVLVAAAGGDEEAFGRLWHDLQPRLLRYFRVVSPAAAEDLASETWLGVVRGIDRFEGNEPAFRAWVFTIARHEVLDWRRRAARRPTEDLGVGALTEQVAPDDPAATAVEGFSTRAALARSPPSPPTRPRRSCCGWWPGWASTRWRPSWASGRGRSGCSPTGGCAGWPSGSAPTASGGWCNAMAADDASSAEMRRPFPGPDADPLALDDETVERLLSGELAPDQAPPGYAEVAKLLAATAAAPRP